MFVFLHNSSNDAKKGGKFARKNASFTWILYYSFHWVFILNYAVGIKGEQERGGEMVKVWLLIKSDLKILRRWSPWRCRWLLVKRRQTGFSWWDSLARWRLFLMKHELMFMCGWFLSEGGREKANIDSRRLSLKLERNIFFRVSHREISRIIFVWHHQMDINGLSFLTHRRGDEWN